ncbi:MAG TPA: UDP-N-acetylmuramoyl-L-alanyl-D-glutamate--2,6-diaminopimelate ligase, partial [Candidatus Omnitrophota bacterium]|nr:UDP-N-acetylmuramoyl-L-alanyl-D-glutamate--2,6-diaminopimelate ligase [Candidatus Omnitrophota bacterium]
KLFTDHCSKESNLIINVDDEFGKRLFEKLKGKKICYGFTGADVSVIRHDMKREGTRAKIKTPKGDIEIRTRLVGRYNLYNILAAVSVGIAEGIKPENIEKGVAALESVPGRLERIDSKKGFSIFVDYAHTDDALKNVLESLHSLIHNGRIITVFGCGGDRDKRKRPKMGEAACSLSDHVIITSDNPRNEEPLKIIEDIVSGIPLDNFEIEPDRKKAIVKAVGLARPGDFILVAGKGHENYQIIKNNIFPFDDKAVVVEAII